MEDVDGISTSALKEEGCARGNRRSSSPIERERERDKHRRSGCIYSDPQRHTDVCQTPSLPLSPSFLTRLPPLHPRPWSLPDFVFLAMGMNVAQGHLFGTVFEAILYGQSSLQIPPLPPLHALPREGEGDTRTALISHPSPSFICAG